MKKVVLFASVVLLVGLLGGCSKSSSLDCSDYAKKICTKVGGCVGASSAEINECTALLNTEVRNDRVTTAECKDAWEQINATPCSALF